MMTDRPEIAKSDPSRQFRVQMIVAAAIAAIICVVWLSHVWKQWNWPVVTATLSDVQTVPCKRACGGAKTLVYATVEFDRPAPSGPVRCKVENYNIARGDEKVAATMRIAVRPDSCDDWRIVASSNR